MAEEKQERDHNCIMIERINELEEKMEKLKGVMEDYLTLSNEFARASIVTALKNI